MPTLRKKNSFINSEEGDETRVVLEAMLLDKGYITASSYSSKVNIYPNNVIPFVDKHMEYLNAHPDTNPQQYLANLRLMTRVK